MPTSRLKFSRFLWEVIHVYLHRPGRHSTVLHGNIPIIPSVSCIFSSSNMRCRPAVSTTKPFVGAPALLAASTSLSFFTLLRWYEATYTCKLININLSQQKRLVLTLVTTMARFFGRQPKSHKLFYKEQLPLKPHGCCKKYPKVLFLCLYFRINTQCMVYFT